GFSRREVDEYLGILLQAQLRPQMVTLSSSALASTLAFCAPQSVSPCVLLIPEESWVEMDSIGGRHLVASQVVPITKGISGAELDELLAQVIIRNFPGASPTETPVFLCSVQDTFPLTVDADRDLQALT